MKYMLKHSANGASVLYHPPLDSSEPTVSINVSETNLKALKKNTSRFVERWCMEILKKQGRWKANQLKRSWERKTAENRELLRMRGTRKLMVWMKFRWGSCATFSNKNMFIM